MSWVTCKASSWSSTFMVTFVVPTAFHIWALGFLFFFNSLEIENNAISRARFIARPQCASSKLYLISTRVTPGLRPFCAQNTASVLSLYIISITVPRCGVSRLPRRWGFSGLVQYCSSRLWRKCPSGSSPLDIYATTGWSADLEAIPSQTVIVLHKMVVCLCLLGGAKRTDFLQAFLVTNWAGMTAQYSTNDPTFALFFFFCSYYYYFFFFCRWQSHPECLRSLQRELEALCRQVCPNRWTHDLKEAKSLTFWTVQLRSSSPYNDRWLMLRCPSRKLINGGNTLV